MEASLGHGEFKTSQGNLVKPYLKIEKKRGWVCNSEIEELPSNPSSFHTMREEKEEGRDWSVASYVLKSLQQALLT